jgi:hypothetical protein
MKLQLLFSKDRATGRLQKILFIFNGVVAVWVNCGDLAAAPFSARRQDLPSPACQNRFG